MLTKDSLELMPEGIRSDRFVIMEYVKGAPVDIQVTANGVTFLNSHGAVMDCPEVSDIHDVVVERTLAMFKDFKEIIMEHHKAADYLEAEGQTANRPDVPRDFQTLTLKAWIAGGEYPNVPVVFHGEPKGAPYYCQDISIFVYSMLIDGVEQDIYQLGATCGSYGIPIAPVMGFKDTIDEAMAYSEATVAGNSVVSSQSPLLDSEGNPEMTEEGYFQNLPVLEENQKFGHLIRSVQGRGVEHYVAHLN